jgi:hypothetical protein
VTPLTQPIAVQRTALLTIRPIGVRVTVRGATECTDYGAISACPVSNPSVQ